MVRHVTRPPAGEGPRLQAPSIPAAIRMVERRYQLWPPQTPRPQLKLAADMELRLLMQLMDRHILSLTSAWLHVVAELDSKDPVVVAAQRTAFEQAWRRVEKLLQD